MKVKDLIKRLKKLPRNADVYINTATDVDINLAQLVRSNKVTWQVNIEPKKDVAP